MVKRKRRAKNEPLKTFFILGFVLVFVSFVVATAPSWGTSSLVNYSTVEEAFYFYNL